MNPENNVIIKMIETIESKDSKLSNIAIVLFIHGINRQFLQKIMCTKSFHSDVFTIAKRRF
jgi:hypothetical protein